MSAEVKEAAAELLEDREEDGQKEKNADEETNSDSDTDSVSSSCATAIEQAAEQKPVEFEIVYVHIPEDAKEVDLTRHRMKTIHGLETFTQVEKLCLRWNLLKQIENLDCTANTLTELDLYDNQMRGT
ncbi:hypothetical protein WR25_05799 [Diploscapter pachys]|uniref:Protein phosphatase 1 regulatory subunit 7 n=1 Tax=Diploscapter pachys TaxID=2018661 RepID=A0A2A2LYX9_9BILA|nr:hypothetical protein WR25_05799 [Diploscapter pachys]